MDSIYSEYGVQNAVEGCPKCLTCGRPTLPSLLSLPRLRRHSVLAVQNEGEQCPKCPRCSAVRVGRRGGSPLAERDSTPENIMQSGVQNYGVEVVGSVLSRPVSPKLAHEAVLAKPPYFADTSCTVGVQNERDWCPKCKDREW